ncbi:MAG: Riboflavin biosynthesis protein ribD [Microbacteriaceae bacterium]|nr:Riboflavin biosynthesis protein ribD [Microbacteriaceae bacterium]
MDEGKDTMGRLIYTAITSLDGYIADGSGSFDWSMPDEEVHGFINDQERAFGTYLYGRRLYEVMVAWETLGTGPDESREIRDYASIWKAADKIVFSSTLREVASERTRIERSFVPELVERLKVESPADLTVGGAELAGHALVAGLVDELRLFVSPVIVGGGTRALPAGLRLGLRLLDERRFGNGVVYSAYGVARSEPSPLT